MEEIFKMWRDFSKSRIKITEELVRDLIGVVTSFSGRIYGKRGAKRIVQTIKDETWLR